jgi:hypothetical protein
VTKIRFALELVLVKLNATQEEMKILFGKKLNLLVNHQSFFNFGGIYDG